MDALSLVIDLILTIFVYLIYPISYRCANGKVSKSKGKKIALLNSIICAGLFCLVRAVITNGAIVVTTFAPAVLYYFIAKLILIDKNKVDNKDEDLQKNDNQNKLMN